MLLQINPKAYVRWLLTLPMKRRMEPPTQAQAIAVSRYLSRMSVHTPDSALVENLALDVLLLSRHLYSSDAATHEACIQFLEKAKPYLPSPAYAPVMELLKSSPKSPAESDGGAEGSPACARSTPYVEYRAEGCVPFGAPALVCYPRKNRRKWPEDDLSERICKAYEGLELGRCSRTLYAIVDVLKQHEVLPASYCTIQHVISRLKVGRKISIPESEQESPAYFRGYWISLNKNSGLKSATDPDWPTQFEFERCDC